MESEEIEILPLPQEQVAEFIPEALRTAMTKYHERAGVDTSEMTAKEFADHQKACQTAVAHIEMILKLALRAQLPEGDSDANRREITAALMLTATADVTGFESKN